jgi:hypothetical protein
MNSWPFLNLLSPIQGSWLLEIYQIGRCPILLLLPLQGIFYNFNANLQIIKS